MQLFGCTEKLRHFSLSVSEGSTQQCVSIYSKPAIGLLTIACIEEFIHSLLVLILSTTTASPLDHLLMSLLLFMNKVSYM